MGDGGGDGRDARGQRISEGRSSATCCCTHCVHGPHMVESNLTSPRLGSRKSHAHSNLALLDKCHALP